MAVLIDDWVTALEAARLKGLPEAPARISNEAAIQLLRSWRAGDEREQRETWDYLRKALDEDRLSDRKLSP